MPWAELALIMVPLEIFKTRFFVCYLEITLFNGNYNERGQQKQPRELSRAKKVEAFLVSSNQSWRPSNNKLPNK